MIRSLPLAVLTRQTPGLIPGVLLCAFEAIHLSWRSRSEPQFPLEAAGVAMKQTILKLTVLSLLLGASLTILIDYSSARRARNRNSDSPSSAAPQGTTLAP